MFEQLRRQNELLLNAAGDGILGLDVHERITFANPVAARLLGRYVSELIGEPVYEVLYGPMPDDGVRTHSTSAIKAALENGFARQATTPLSVS